MTGFKTAKIVNRKKSKTPEKMTDSMKNQLNTAVLLQAAERLLIL